MEIIGNINMKLLQTFLVVAEHGSFRLAAEILHRSHSAISAQIMQLESQLDVRLFDRTTRSVKLTDEGVYLRDSAQKAVYEVQLGIRRIREAHDTKRGQLSLASSSNIASIHLPPVLTEFVRDFPGIAVSVRELTSRELYDAVHKKEVDFAVGPEGIDDGLSFETIMDEPLKALVPRHFLTTESDSITLTELARFPMLLQTPATAVRRLLDEELMRKGIVIPTRYQFIQAETIVAMAEAGLGVAVLPSSRLEKADTKAARVLNLIEPTITRKMALITLRGQQLSPAAKRLANKIVVDVRIMTKYGATASKSD